MGVSRKGQAPREGEPDITVRPARRGEMPAIRDLISRFPGQLMQEELPGIRSFFVAVLGTSIVGCAALQVYSPRLAELRSLAVDEEFAGQGIATRLVEACKKRAEEREVHQVLAVTSETGFFGKRGFETFRGEKTAVFYDVPRVTRKFDT